MIKSVPTVGLGTALTVIHPTCWSEYSASTQILHQSSRNVDFSFRIRFYLLRGAEIKHTVFCGLWERDKRFFCVIRRQVLTNSLAYHHWRHLELSRSANLSGLSGCVAGAELFQRVHYRTTLLRNK